MYVNIDKCICSVPKFPMEENIIKIYLNYVKMM